MAGRSRTHAPMSAEALLPASPREGFAEAPDLQSVGRQAAMASGFVTNTGTGFHLSSGSGAMVSTAVTAPASSSFSARRVVMPVHCAPG